VRVLVDLSIAINPGIAENAAMTEDHGVASHLGIIGYMGAFKNIRHSASSFFGSADRFEMDL
jgi:hypothetical protein